MKLLRKSTCQRTSSIVAQNGRTSTFNEHGVLSTGTVSVIKFEKETGLGLGRNGNNHIQKGRDMIKYLDRISKSQSLSNSDLKLAKKSCKQTQKGNW